MREIYLSGKAAASEVHSHYGKKKTLDCQSQMACKYLNKIASNNFPVNTDGIIIYIYLRNFLCEHHCGFEKCRCASPTAGARRFWLILCGKMEQGFQKPPKNKIKNELKTEGNAHGCSNSCFCSTWAWNIQNPPKTPPEAAARGEKVPKPPKSALSAAGL